MLMYQFTCVIFFITIVNRCNAQEGAACQTPSQEAGVCISIKSCNPLVNLLKSRGATQEVATLLRNSACGWEGQFPLVCCPQIITKGPEPETTERLHQQSREETSSEYSGTTLPRTPHCGFSNTTKTRIVNGVPAKLGEYPWIVALGYRNTKNPDQPKWLCGGSLITDRHVLTAAHCVYNRQNSLYLARLGELDLYSDDDGAQPTNIGISKMKIHEQFSATAYTNDIAILTLAERNTNPTAYPICLPIDEPIKSNNFVGFSVFVAGWGALYFNGPSSSGLQTAILPVVTNEQCSRAFVNFRTTTIDQRVICAGFGGQDACQGDSGGPLMYAKTQNKSFLFYQVGLVSYGFRCAEVGYPGVYTRITSFIDWINQNLD